MIVFQTEHWQIDEQLNDEERALLHPYKVRCECPDSTLIAPSPEYPMPEGFIEVGCSKCGRFMSKHAYDMLMAFLRLMRMSL